MIREAAADDAPAINDIANWFIEHTPVNFDVDPWPLQKRQAWIAEFNRPDNGYKLLIAEHQGRTIGFACNTRFRPKAAYDRSTETTVYLANDARRPGTGSALYTALFDRICGAGFHRAYAVITLPNPRSITLHENFGFTEVGLFNEIGYKFEQFHNVAIYEKNLSGDTIR